MNMKKEIPMKQEIASNNNEEKKSGRFIVQQ